MKLNYLVIFIAILPIEEIFSQSSVYYPLNVGDFWQYHYISREVLRDTVFPNGLTYAIILESWGSDLGPTYYHRQSGDSVFHY
ncbi:hypothetical protein ISS37_01795 [candidate division KSB1 bacterium]|nr:hypothetical protein [candidate division KSB1 bacterium]